MVIKTKERISIKSSFYETLKVQPFRMIMGFGFAFNLSTSMIGSLGYYTTVYYVCRGSTIMGDNWNFWMGIAFMLGGLLGAPILNRVANQIGKRRAVIAAACIGIVGYGGSWYLYTPLIPWLQTVASGTMGFAASALWMLHGSIGADIIDYDELNTGKRREGSFTACGSYILKLGNSAGYFIFGLILSRIGFDSSLTTQSPETILWIRRTLAGIPILGFIVVIIFILRMGLTREKCEEIRRELEKRRGTV